MSVDDETVAGLLDAEVVAVVGCSATPGKAAHEVPAYLKRHGYDVIPVNPFHDEVLGERAYDAVGDVPQSVDLVDVFRPSEEVSGVVDAVLDRVARRGDVGGLWLQRGIRDDDAAARAREAGLRVVQDRCLKVAHTQRRGR